MYKWPTSLRRSLLSLLLISVAVGCEVPPQPVEAPEIRWDRYHLFHEMTEALQYLAREYPHLVTMESAGKTVMMNRDIWLVTLTNSETGPAEDKPGFWLDGGTHAGERGSSETALYTAWYLATAYGEDPEVTELLDTRVIYIMPRKDADGMEYSLTRVLEWDPEDLPAMYIRRCTDPPSDITGNGEILRMRVLDPEGEWRISDEDPRMMVRREEEDEGPFYRVMSEGLDDNGDGEINSDPCPVLSSNRNYPARWDDGLGHLRGGGRPEVSARHGGQYPTQEPETRATVDAVFARPNIAGMESLHHSGGVILRPLSNLSDDVIPEHDLAYFDHIAQRGRELTDYGYTGVFHGFTSDPTRPRHGVQVDWGYLHLGLYAYTTEQWRYIGNIGPTDPYEGQTELERLRVNDEVYGGAHFMDWEPFDHPQLGEVEIGGWVDYSLSNPPPEVMEEMMLRPVMRWVLHQASVTPLVRVREVEVEAMGDGTHRVTARVANEGLLPTNLSEQALLAGIARPVEVQLHLGEGVSLVEGEAVVEVGHMEGAVEVSGFGGDNERVLEWTVSGGGELTVEAISEKGGRHRATAAVSGPS